jgi:hypothetical protein
MLERRYFAVVQLGGAVYGLGYTEDDAKNDSLIHIASVTTINELDKLLVPCEDAKKDDYFICESSEEFFDYVQFMGGNFSHSLDENGFLIKE